jgi:hypothetical protein
VTAAKWAVWSLQRSDGRGLQVSEGTKAEAQASAVRRNEAAVRQKVTSVVFIALPVGQQPTWEDIPPSPEPAEAPAAQPRTLMSVQNDLSALAQSVPTSPSWRAEASVTARDLAAEAFELGKAESAAEQRKALGKAWSAVLEMIPDEFWRELPYTDPELAARFCRVVLGEGRD